MRHRLAGASLICLAWCVQAAGQSAIMPESGTTAANEAIAVVASLHRALYELGTIAEHGVDERYTLIAPVVAETHDLPYIARFVVRRYWDNFDAQQQADFVDHFEVLSTMNYASRFTSFNRDAVNIVGTQAISTTRVQVDAVLVAADNDELTLSYTLHRVGEKWLIINVVADGVSDLALRRAEYSRVLSDQDFTALLEYLERQTAEMK